MTNEFKGISRRTSIDHSEGAAGPESANSGFVGGDDDDHDDDDDDNDTVGGRWVGGEVDEEGKEENTNRKS